MPRFGSAGTLLAHKISADDGRGPLLDVAFRRRKGCMNMEAPIEDQRIPIEDAKLAIEIFKKALEYRPQIKAAIVGGEYLALSNEERMPRSA